MILPGSHHGPGVMISFLATGVWASVEKTGAWRSALKQPGTTLCTDSQKTKEALCDLGARVLLPL